MTENGNQQRPVRKLTVDNFSVIKHAELEFGKITVLIGPQASGKSMLCKLAYFFQQVVVERAEESIKESEAFERFQKRIGEAFHLWFTASVMPATSILGSTSRIEFSDGEYWVRVSCGRGDESDPRIRVDLSEDIRKCYETVRDKLENEKQRRESLPNPKFFAEEVRDQLSRLRQSETPDIYSYIPSTRSFFLSIHQAIRGTAGRFDDISLRFSQDFSYGFENRISKAGLEHPLTQWVNAQCDRILQGKVVSAGSDYLFQSVGGYKLMLPALSSGTQELLPLMTCLREFVAASAGIQRIADAPNVLKRRLFFLEEPESNVFPSTQYDLVRIFARLANEPSLDAHWVITTHSPYILTAFNNLIEAAQVVAAKPELKNEVAKRIPEQYWIKPSDFKAYAVEDEVLESIVAEDTGLISANYLDQVSETIGAEFDELLRLGYVES